ncbi:MAG: hypothetical protein ACP5I8_09520 [Phycisphaerae bacterium]
MAFLACFPPSHSSGIYPRKKGLFAVNIRGVGGIATILGAAGLYALLFLAGVALAIAGLILGIAEALLLAALALLGAWVVGKVLTNLVAEDRKKRNRHR